MEPKKGDVVLSFYGGMIYEAEVLREVKGKGTTPRYRLHYKGWGPKYDQTVSLDQIVPDTGHNRAVMKQVNAYAHEMFGNRKKKPVEPVPDAFRAREGDQQVGRAAWGAETRIHLSAPLRRRLTDDWEQITQAGRLARLARLEYDDVVEFLIKEGEQREKRKGKKGKKGKKKGGAESAAGVLGLADARTPTVPVHRTTPLMSLTGMQGGTASNGASAGASAGAGAREGEGADEGADEEMGEAGSAGAVRRPTVVPVDDILRIFATERRAAIVAEDGSAAAAGAAAPSRLTNARLPAPVFDAMTQAIQLLFDRVLPMFLLYRFERQQYEDVAHFLRLTEQQCPLSSLYGGEHLLRLLHRLPDLLHLANFSEQDRNMMAIYCAHLVAFLGKRVADLIPLTYQAASSYYVEEFRAKGGVERPDPMVAAAKYDAHQKASQSREDGEEESEDEEEDDDWEPGAKKASGRKGSRAQR